MVQHSAINMVAQYMLKYISYADYIDSALLVWLWN